MRGVVINNCYGGFGLSEKARYRYEELKKKAGEVVPDNYWRDSEIEFRADPILVKVVRELGKEANRGPSDLIIVGVEEGNLEYARIEEYDGAERIEYDLEDLVEQQREYIRPIR